MARQISNIATLFVRSIATLFVRSEDLDKWSRISTKVNRASGTGNAGRTRLDGR